MRVTDTFDFVVVGGGSGGCTVAGRLSEDPNDVGGAAGRRRQERQLGGHHAVRAGADGRRQRQQLGLQHRAAEGPQRPHRLSAARQGARRLVRHQRDGLYPRPPQPTTTNGPRSAMPAGRSPTCCPTSSAPKNNADFDGEYHGKGGPLAVNKLAHRQSGAADLPAGRAGSAVPHPRGFQCRRARRPRHLSGDAEERRTLERRARLYPPAYGQAAPICASRPTRTPPASCSRASARSASNTGRARS